MLIECNESHIYDGINKLFLKMDKYYQHKIKFYNKINHGNNLEDIWYNFTIKKFKYFKSIYYLLNKNFNYFFYHLPCSNDFLNQVYVSAKELLKELNIFEKYLNGITIITYLPKIEKNVEFTLTNYQSNDNNRLINYNKLVYKTINTYVNYYQDNLLKIYSILSMKLPNDTIHVIIKYLFNFNSLSY